MALEGNSLAPKPDENLTPERNHWRISWSHSNTIFRRKIQLQKTIVFACSLQLQATLDAAIPMRSAETELQNTIELRAMASEIVAPKPDGSRRQSEKKTILKHFLKRFLEGKSLAPKTHFVRESPDKTPSATHPPAPLAIPFTLQERSYSCKSQWNSVDRACTKNTWNQPFTMRNRSDHESENDPTMVREWSDHTRDRLAPVAPQR